MAIQYSFMHIGKTGGTAFNHVIDKHNQTNALVRVNQLGHRISLKEIAERDLTDKLIFFVREPVSRFVSAFNSRLRKGRFGTNEWTPGEKEAFTNFRIPNDLGEALGSLNPLTYDKAQRACNSIFHINKPLHDYLGPLDLLKLERRRIFFIGLQETLSCDFEYLKVLLQMDPALALPSDQLRAHKAPDDMNRNLSERAIGNIRRWYAKDFPIHQWCLEYRETLLLRHGLIEEKAASDVSG